MKHLITLLISLLFASCGQSQKVDSTHNTDTIISETIHDNAVNDTVTLGGGCFWCVEAIYEMLEGVTSVQSGYSGGTKENATYYKVSSGKTKHAEVIQIVFDTTKVSIYEVLEVFFSVHDPTTLNRQGADAGYQYRSVVFYKNEEQKQIVDDIIEELIEQKIYNKPIVTKVSKFETFYSAEQYHQDYYANNSSGSYCAAVITPKIKKFKKLFADKVKSNK